MARLIALHYSPWSEQARWALEHHRLPFQYTEYLPMLGEPILRMVSRRPWRKATVPLLLDAGKVLRDSFDIALHADAQGAGPTLFPDRARISDVNRIAESIKSAGRALVIDATLNNTRALEESLPPFFPARLQGPLRPVGHMGARFLASKHASGKRLDEDQQTQIMRDGLEEWRRQLQDRPHFLDDFSYADIVAATTLQFVLPPGNAFCSLGPASRDAWTRPDLAVDFADLLAWRDQLYRNHRLRA